MALAPQLTRFVSKTVQHRGSEYFANGRVEILEADARAVHAIVHGTYEYQVSLVREASEILAACSCPYFGDRRIPCKHVWGAILAADARGALAGPPHAHGEPLQLETVAPEDAGLETEYSDWAYKPTEWRPWQPPATYSRPARKVDRWSEFSQTLERDADARAPAGSLPQQILYLVDGTATGQAYTVVIEIAGRDRKLNGSWGKPRPLKLTLADVRYLPDPLDRRLIERLHGAIEHIGYSSYPQLDSYAWQPIRPSVVRLGPLLCADLAPDMSAAGRLCLRLGDNAGGQTLQPLVWDDGEPWTFALEIAQSDPQTFLVTASFRRGETRRAVRDEHVIPADGVLIIHAPPAAGDAAGPSRAGGSAEVDAGTTSESTIARLDSRGARPWIRELRQRGPIEVPAASAPSLIDAVAHTGVAVAAWPGDLRYADVRTAPKGRLVITKSNAPYVQARLLGELSFAYGETIVDPQASAPLVVDHTERVFVHRDHAAEQLLRRRLLESGFRWANRDRAEYEIAESRLTGAIVPLVREGWTVSAEGRLYRTARRVEMHVSSGIDWFELDGAVAFDEMDAPLPELLAAVRRGRSYVQLGDGSIGMLPDEWLQKYGTLAALTNEDGGRIRFAPGQVGLLDALLAEQPEVSWDEGFGRAREAFARFAGIHPADPPPTFAGELRGYQREGLGWLQFLRESGFGGCLADDMGLGKTVMVLALLERVRVEPSTSAPRRPSLIVVPRSLVFNWIQEASRFTPSLRVVDYSGSGRSALDESLVDHDVVLTTYGTLRRDAARLKDVRFEYVVLDEAQAIKNAATASAKAARLLQANHRLALSGTPIENHLGELWSLFEFLNPGLLGAASLFKSVGPGAARQDPQTIALVARGLKPFILRRTKEQVVRELPPKVEQTIYCELDPPQRKVYDELKRHYQRTLIARITRDGIAKSRMQILEALLRLRQAACHPALIDRGRASEPSAKLDVLMSRIEESREEDHKALVFSQFTSFLALVRARLDEAGIDYEYLDGQTRDRAARVERFQTDPSCRLFLISLKAGGLGLNLTAAEHVFLLDPWWNPASEAQAIDRAHRIGQWQRVFAFRLIARDTVEERVLELQNTKRALADAILGEGADLARTLKKEDLELLLS
jgi:superfamily II DNA or RNA helicase